MLEMQTGLSNYSTGPDTAGAIETNQNANYIETVESNHEESIDPKVYSLLHNARVLIKHEEYKLALNILRQACTMQTHTLVLNEMTRILIRLEKWNEANITAQQWYRLNPDFDSCYSKAQIEYQLQQDEKSLQSYFEALSYISDAQAELFEIFKNVGNIFVRKGDFESAEEFYNKAHAVNGSSDILYVNYGILEMQRGDLNRAKDRFRSAVHFNARNDKAWVGLAMVHFEFGDEELGIANLKKALDIAPLNKTAISFALQKMSQRVHTPYVIEVLQNYLDQADFDEEISCQLIQKFYELGRFELALIESQRLLLWVPEKPEYYKLVSELEKQQQAQQSGQEKAAC